MSEKLVRNISEKRWREYWKAVDAAASNAPKLRYHDTAREPRRCDVSRLTAERLRELAKWQRDSVAGAWLTPPLLGGDHLALIEHAARVVEAAEPAVSRRYCRRGHAKADECLAELRLFLYKLDAALDGTEGE